eukprot:1687797-Rhodomonas_salina.3
MLAGSPKQAGPLGPSHAPASPHTAHTHHPRNPTQHVRRLSRNRVLPVLAPRSVQLRAPRAGASSGLAQLVGVQAGEREDGVGAREREPLGGLRLERDLAPLAALGHAHDEQPVARALLLQLLEGALERHWFVPARAVQVQVGAAHVGHGDEAGLLDHGGDNGLHAGLEHDLGGHVPLDAVREHQVALQPRALARLLQPLLHLLRAHHPDEPRAPRALALRPLERRQLLHRRQQSRVRRPVHVPLAVRVGEHHDDVAVRGAHRREVSGVGGVALVERDLSAAPARAQPARDLPEVLARVAVRHHRHGPLVRRHRPQLLQHCRAPLVPVQHQDLLRALLLRLARARPLRKRLAGRELRARGRSCHAGRVQAVLAAPDADETVEGREPGVGGRGEVDLVAVADEPDHERLRERALRPVSYTHLRAHETEADL